MSETVILIVDDDRTIVRLCQLLLERNAFQVISSIDPLDALRILEQQKVDLLLSDIRMPVMDGFELILRAKQLQPDLPVLVMTGYGSIDTAIQALHRGVDGLILKPFDNPKELIVSVQRVLDESRRKRDAARLLALRPLFDVTERLLSETSPQALEELILETITRLFQADFAGIYRLPGNNSLLETVRETETLSEQANGDLEILLCETLIAGPSGLHAASGPGSSTSIQYEMKMMGWGTLLVARIQQSSGSLVFCASRQMHRAVFAEADHEMFVILARQAAVAAENANLYTDLKEYVKQVEESQRALVQAEKMAAVGRLMASMAHEINNPLQAVRNSLHLAARKEIDANQRMQFLQMTDIQLERLVKMVRQMLDFYRPGKDEWEPVNIRQIIDQILALIGPHMEDQRVKVNLNYRTEDVTVLGSADQLQQVLFNLMINAVDSFEEAAGNQEDQGKEIWIDINRDETGLHILVEDSGPGIPQEMQERIFEPFVSTKKNGTGLGLAVSYGIMERHLGSLRTLPPRYGNGACFEMIMPVGGEGNNG